MKKKVLRILAVLLIFSICTSLLPASVLAVPEEEPVNEKTPTIVDFIAGTATAEDIYGVLDASIVPAIINYEEAVEKNHIARCYEDEGTDLNKIVFWNIDGTKTMYTFDFPVKYVDDNGNIQDIRLEIADSTVNTGEFETAANDTVTTFSAQFADGIALEGNDTEIRLIPILPSANSGMATMSTTNIATTTATAQRIDADTVAYPYDAKTTVEYSLTYTGFKEDIVVSEYTGQTTYPFRLLTNGLALEEIAGSFFLVDGEGNIEASIGDIIIFTADERNNAFGDIEPQTIVENQEYLLNIVVDADYLADPATIYPIRIDPTIEIKYSNNGAGAVEDITISTNTNFSGSHTSLYVGRRSTEGIARALIRFPALDVSSLAGATVTSATIRVRDLMCESKALDVSCHVFTGNVWNANSATWANVSPNSYVSTPLSTRTLSWSIGDAFSSKHWYTFDVTSAVQGWIDGNYNKNKGIIFKVASSIENGSAIKNRTFGSYNRSSYRPSITVNYTEPGTQFVANDTYYLNNRGTGKYLQLNTAGKARGASGLLSELGNRIQWQVQKVGSGYVIRSVNDPTKYLGASELASNNLVYITTVNNTAIPTTCLWVISAASGGGCLIRNAASTKYLYSSGTDLSLANSVGSYGSERYETFVWRMAPISYYGNTSAYSNRELPTSFRVNNIHIDVGDRPALTIDTIYTNVLWASPSDFDIIIGDTDVVQVTSDNRILGCNRGTCSITIRHKVTDNTVVITVNVSSTYASTLAKFTSLYNAALSYDDTPRDAAILALQFIRRGKYSGATWTTVAGSIDLQFVGYIENNYPALFQYFTVEIEGEEYYYTDPSGDGYVDFPHLCATLNGLIHDSTGFKAMFAGEANINNLCGWAGDLQTLCIDVLDYTNNSNDYDTVYNATCQLVGDSEQSLSTMDLLADTDSYNIYNLLNSSHSNLISAFTTYYNDYSDTRYTLFTNGWSKQRIYNCVRNYTTNTFIFGVDWPLLEGHNISDTQANAIASAFTDFIWEKIQNE